MIRLGYHNTVLIDVKINLFMYVYNNSTSWFNCNFSFSTSTVKVVNRSNIYRESCLLLIFDTPSIEESFASLASFNSDITFFNYLSRAPWKIYRIHFNHLSIAFLDSIRQRSQHLSLDSNHIQNLIINLVFLLLMRCTPIFPHTTSPKTIEPTAEVV